MRITRDLLALGLIAATMSNSMAAHPPRVCDDIDLDSVGVRSFDHARIRGVAYANGLRGRADYVRIIPPPRPDAAMDEALEQVLVVADIRPMEAPKCATVVDPKASHISCTQRVGQQLLLIAKFTGGDEEGRLKEMPSLVDYVRHEVLCEPNR